MGLCAAAAAGAQPHQAAPRRIVSMNPCVDAVLLRVADPGQIAAISHWSHDPRATSAPIAQARRFPAHMGTTEEVIRLQPDLLFVSRWMPMAARAALTRLQVNMVQVDVPANVDDSFAQIRAIAAAAGHPERGEQLVREIGRAIERARRAPPRPALMRMSSGFVPGPGSLSEALMANSGLQSLSAGYGLKSAGSIGLEPLVLKAPPLLITDRPEAVAPLLRRLPVRVAGFDRRLLNCGGPSIGPAARRLAEIRDALP
jgi:iron complex transport system substrate-binding protein